ncbi:MAG: putative peptidoglycan hydrolase [Prokaryotic dsDNA virus sp.]|nr:MAG: putative peptidoglycan hydrolase [Prokaryotic dsDNA virus sp.]|tara:strand:+ start:20433 stop:20867 length:435 start_codon:yes stop_codon:yes gene_type:complete
MTTIREVVEDAFEEIGVKTAEVPLTNDELQSGIRRCNDMLTGWDDIGIIVGYTEVLSGDDTMKVDRSAVGAIKYNLAVRLAPSYQKVVSATLFALSTSTLDILMASNTDLSEIAYPDTLPVGSGNECPDYNRNRFFPSNKTDNF